MRGRVWEGVGSYGSHVSAWFEPRPDHVCKSQSCYEIHWIGIKDSHTHFKPAVNYTHSAISYRLINTHYTATCTVIISNSIS